MRIYTQHLKGFVVCITLMIFGMQSIYADDTKNEALDSAEGTVKRLYRDYAWEAIGLKGNYLLDQSKQELEKYFESSLANLIIEDNECRKRTHDICHLDFNIIFASQDPAAVDLKITKANINGEVNVRFEYPSNREVVEIRYIFVKTKSGWRIHDIVYVKERKTLREILNLK